MKLNNSQELADFIQQQRKKQSRTQTDVAKHIGLKQKTISAMENSAGTSRIDTLFKIANELGLSVELVSRTDTENNKNSGWDQEW